MREIDVRDADLDPHGTALCKVDGRLVLVTAHAGQECRHVLDREVHLEPGGLVRHQPVAIRVALVEGVVGEGLDDVEQLGAELVAVSRRSTSRDELLSLSCNQLAILLAAGLSKVVGLFERVAGELLGHSHHRLLVDHQALRVAKQRLEIVVRVGDLLSSVLAIGVVVVHVGRHRTRPIQRH